MLSGVFVRFVMFAPLFFLFLYIAARTDRLRIPFLDARSQFILCGNFLIYLFLLALNPEQVRDTFMLLGKFHDSLQRLSATADKFAIGLLRPVALRIDSFFTQAAQVMRTNGQSPPS
jgi:hypothetical protein